MTAEIVNLRRARKAKARTDRARTAEENRQRFGEKISERAPREIIRRRDEERLDGAMREVHKQEDESK